MMFSPFDKMASVSKIHGQPLYALLILYIGNEIPAQNFLFSILSAHFMEVKYILEKCNFISELLMPLINVYLL